MGKKLAEGKDVVQGGGRKSKLKTRAGRLEKVILVVKALNLPKEAKFHTCDDGNGYFWLTYEKDGKNYFLPYNSISGGIGNPALAQDFNPKAKIGGWTILFDWLKYSVRHETVEK